METAENIIQEIRKRISKIEKLPSAPMDGEPEHQRVNGTKLVAKLFFYDAVKEMVDGNH